MTIEELTRHYVKAYKNGPLSSETRTAYDNLKRYGDLLGINLSKKFFQELLERYQSSPQKYLEKTPEEIDQDILSQYGRYMQQLQLQKEKPEAEAVGVKRQERRETIEIL